MPFILEGIATTSKPNGQTNIAAMGPIVHYETKDETKISRLLFRPFQDSQTCKNLLATKQGVFHLCDDVLLFAQAVTKNLSPNQVPLKKAAKVEGFILENACQWFEFQIVASDTSSQRAELEAEVVATGTGRNFHGFNRASHAVIEAAILATRTHLVDPEFLSVEMWKYKIIIDKTAGQREFEAFELIQQYIKKHPAPKHPFPKDVS